MLESDDNVPLSVFTRSDRLRPNTKFSRLSGTESDKSFVDDSDMERGIVSMRVGLSYDLLRLSPCSGDLYYRKPRGLEEKSLLPRTPKLTNKQTNTNTPPNLSSTNFDSSKPPTLQKAKFIYISVCYCPKVSMADLEDLKMS